MKPILIYIILTTMSAFRYDIRKDLKTEMVPDYVFVSKIVESDWATASN